MLNFITLCWTGGHAVTSSGSPPATADVIGEFAQGTAEDIAQAICSRGTDFHALPIRATVATSYLSTGALPCN